MGENLQKKEKEYEVKMDALSNKITAGEASIKEFMKAGKKDKAKAELKKVKMQRENLISLQNKQGFITKQIINMEGMQDDAGMTDVMKDANKVMQKNVEKNEEFREQIETAKELQMEQAMNREMINGLMEDDDDDELDDQMNKEDALNMEKNFAGTDQNIITSGPAK